MEATRGRPSTFSQEIADFICSKLELGESLNSICRDESLPRESTVRKWALENREGFYTQYARARQVQAERWIDEIVTIADSAAPEDYNCARLRVDTRKWIASKVLPKVYGDAQLLKHADADGNVLKIELSRVEPRPQKVIDVTPAPAALPPAPEPEDTPG
jgi:hypothetical protein